MYILNMLNGWRENMNITKKEIKYMKKNQVEFLEINIFKI